MVLAALIYCASLARGGQDPTDPLIYAPGIRVGSRLQYGLNAVPADWKLTRDLNERTTTDVGLHGFKLITVARPGADPEKTAKSSTDFAEVPCQFVGATPTVTVYSQDGRMHRFMIDSGATRSFMQVALAAELNFGREDPLPMCLYLHGDRWIHFKAEVDRSIAVLANPNPDFPIDGIIGMNAISCLQLKIDYKSRKLWARISSKPLDAASVAGLFAATPSKIQPVMPIPLKRWDSGRYSFDVQFGTKSLPVELDTGASVLGLTSGAISKLGLQKVGEAEVLMQGGTKKLSKFAAPEMTIGMVRFPLPIVHEGGDPRTEMGGFGPSILPHPQVVIDYPGLHLFTLVPTEDELVAQVAGQLISGTVRMQQNELVVDMPDLVGTTKAVVTKFQNHPAKEVLHDLRLLVEGSSAARARILAIYGELNGPKGQLTVTQNGSEAIVATGHR